MRTRYEGDLERIARKYGKIVEEGVIKAATGTGMIMNSEYNHGRPYFVSFRPLLHQVTRLSEDELEKYVKYDKKLEYLRFLVNFLKEKGVDVFDIETELELCDSKLMEGSFDVIDIYLESLEPRIYKEFERRGWKRPEFTKEKVERRELEEMIEKGKKERRKFTKKEQAKGKKIHLENVESEIREIAMLIEELKKQGKDTYMEEIELNRVKADLEVVKATKEEAELRKLYNRLEKLKTALTKKERKKGE
jgi:hypothetical protein